MWEGWLKYILITIAYDTITQGCTLNAMWLHGLVNPKNIISIMNFILDLLTSIKNLIIVQLLRSLAYLSVDSRFLSMPAASA